MNFSFVYYFRKSISPTGLGFVLLLSTLELILGFLFHQFSNFPPPPPVGGTASQWGLVRPGQPPSEVWPLEELYFRYVRGTQKAVCTELSGKWLDELILYCNPISLISVMVWTASTLFFLAIYFVFFVKHIIGPHAFVILIITRASLRFEKRLNTDILRRIIEKFYMYFSNRNEPLSIILSIS